MFDTNLTAEYAAACSLGLDPREFYEAGVAGALCDEATKARLAAIGEAYDWVSGARRAAGGARLARPAPLRPASPRRARRARTPARGSPRRRSGRCAIFTECAHHVEDDAGLPRLVEVQAVRTARSNRSSAVKAR